MRFGVVLFLAVSHQVLALSQAPVQISRDPNRAWVGMTDPTALETLGPRAYCGGAAAYRTAACGYGPTNIGQYAGTLQSGRNAVGHCRSAGRSASRATPIQSPSGKGRTTLSNYCC